jgi:hypothetical protein
MSAKFEVSVQRNVVSPGAPPKQAHKFLFSRVGNELALEVGFYDLW